jgi:TonB-dependent SusC/RagA subfamily outer membrane receptor
MFTFFLSNSKRGLKQGWRFFSFLALIVLATSLEALSQVSGTISSAEDGGLPGVNIIEKGTSNGTVTDANGSFSLSADPNATLIITSVGFITQEVAVNNRSAINLELEPDLRQLEEIVVIGYGTQKKSDVTGAIAQVDQQTINEIPATDFAHALQGRVAGVEFQPTSSRPGSDMQIRIRGNRSLGDADGESNEPLIVLDGIPYSGSLNSINQGDIKSINILKDASATAIYGSRGSNGVILITTNRGGTSGSRFTYNGYYGFSKPLDQYDVFN